MSLVHGTGKTISCRENSRYCARLRRFSLRAAQLAQPSSSGVFTAKPGKAGFRHRGGLAAANLRRSSVSSHLRQAPPVRASAVTLPRRHFYSVRRCHQQGESLRQTGIVRDRAGKLDAPTILQSSYTRQVAL
ncbi:hypothetical protein KCP73_17865 [Salmonella enterica subsp. enterica]|nr:hypothetical protein KCP73_17865 [Salmonella enterica subsp. enterica]